MKNKLSTSSPVLLKVFALAVATLMILARASHAQILASLTDAGATNPIPGAGDIAQFSTSGNQTFPDGLDYYTDAQISADLGEPGQTFTTGTNTAGYTLTSVAVKSGGLVDASGIGTPQAYDLHFYSISGGNAAPLSSYISEPVAYSDGDWLQWSGLSVSLAANATYAYSFGLTSTGIGYENMAVASVNPYTEGQIGLFPPAGGAVTFGPSGDFDAVFDIGIVSANFPSIVQFTESPTNSVFVGTSVTFAASVAGAQPLFLQWRFNGGSGFADIPGANSNTLTLDTVATNSGSYDFVLTNGYGVLTSAPITLTVTHDTTPPTVLFTAVFSPTNVELEFSKVLQAAGTTNIANYVFTDGLAVTGAMLETNNTTVVLTTSPLAYGSNYTLVINGVLDQAIPPNTIATNTSVSFTPSPFAAQDIGNPPIASSVTVTSSNGLNITSDGKDIGSTSDQFNFQYQPQSGNFDVSVCLAGLGLSSLWSQAGLMARESLIAGSPYAAALASPGMNGDLFSYRTGTNGVAATSGSFPVNYPDTWLRLNRVSNLFTGFGSYDGTNWTQLGSATITMPNQIYIGLAVASDNTNQATTAKFVSYETTPTNAVTSTQVNPHEPAGPSSRNTGIVISEIMWKPAPRTDSNDVEFLEIYNTLPYFQDISSYTVTCADMNYTFPANTIIPGGGFFVLAASPQSIANVYGLTSNVFGPYNGSLKHSETLQVLDEQSNVLLTVPYTDVYPWPVAASGTGHSIVLANPTYGEGDWRAWTISDQVGGSPGQADPFTPSPLRNVVINEILPHTENLAVPQFIELYNHSTNSVDVSGCILTDDTTTNKFVIPAGTVIGPAGFVSFTQSQFGFTLNGQGETLYFINPNNTRVLDAVQFGAQADGVSWGRWPDGANDFYALTTNTPGAHNSTIVIGDIVINELMYDPISGNGDDQYIELYNKGTNTINLSGWEFTSGVTFTFPANSLIAPNGYVVVGKNTANLFANYTNLNSGNTYGNYSGKLSHNGELVVLAQPESYFGTNTIYVEEDEVTYGTGGRWGEWSGGGGSSLELIDPHSNHRLAANWADSDETHKSTWVLVQTTGVLANGANYDATIDYAQIGLLDAGECLVDNIEVLYNGVNYVANGTFEGGLGLTDWSLQGALVSSSLENSGYQSSYSLHMRCSDKIWTADNSCLVTLKPNSMNSGDTVTMQYQARWLRGFPEPLFRLSGNWLEATGTIPVPTNLGTPGGPNSQHVPNAGPAMYNVTHTPSVPAANQPVVVTAQAHDPDGIQNLTLYYRLDSTAAGPFTYTAVTMNDIGTGGDAIAGDGIYSATIPGQNSGQIVAFYIAATDEPGAATRFPALRTNDNVPVPECVVMFGDGNPRSSFAVCHLWITQTNVTRWGNLGNLSRDWNNDCTFVDGTRVIYNIGGRFSGSPYHQIFSTPNGAQGCSYEWKFKDDEPYLGVTDYKKIHPPGGDPGTDTSLQESQLAFTFHRALGQPWLYKRYMALFVDGSRRNTTLMEDTQVPNVDIVKEHFPNDNDGFLFKMQPWFEFPSSGFENFYNQSWCTLVPFTTTGGANDVPRYRWNYEIRRSPDTDSDYTNIFSLVDAANSWLTLPTANYVASLEKFANMENWMRVFAANHSLGCWDSFGSPNAQNLFGYIGTQGTKYTLLMWEMETIFGNNGGWSPGQNLTEVNSSDYNMEYIFSTPTFMRMFWRAMQELINGPLNVANSGPLLMAKYNAFNQNGLSTQNPTSAIEPWLSQAQSSIASQLAAVNASSFSVNSTVTLSDNVASVSGVAPVNVEYVSINGVAYPLTWTSMTTWTVTMPLTNGANHLSVVGIDHTGQPIAGDSNQLTVSYTKAIPSPVGHVVINEIMYNPAVTDAQYVELFNNSTNVAYDLSGWQLQGLSYTFPSGSLLPPLGFLVLAQNVPAFSAAYGSTNLVFDTFSATLVPGQLLSLEQPVGGTNLIVAQVQFEDVLPWPTNASSSGVSLQLIDPHQDNWRVGNWSTGETNPPPVVPQWVEASATGTASTSLIYIYLQSAGDVYLDDIELVAGSVPGVGSNTVSDGNFESGFPGPWTVSPNLTESALSTTVELSGSPTLHVVSTAAGTTKTSAIYENISPPLVTNATYTISYWYLQSTNGGPLTVRLSGSGIVDTVNPAPPSAVPLTPFTPNAANSVAATLPAFAPLWINEVEPDNVTGITNSAGEHAPWIELYNPSTNSVALTNLYLAANFTDLTQWAFPSNTTISPGQFLVVFADGQTNLSTLAQLHTSFALNGSNGSVALSRLFDGQPQVLDYLNYQNIQPDWSYGSLPDGQSFVRTAFYSPTPGASNNVSGTPPASFIAYNTDGSIYTQTFDGLPDPGATSVNSANPVTIDGTTYSLANPYDFAFPAITNGSAGGLGLSAMAGWYGSSALLSRFGATDGDQTTGGQISFGPPNSSNRALGLLATSTTGSTAIGAKLINNTGTGLNSIGLQVTGEIWRQSNLPKTLQCYYWIDPTATAPMPSQATAYLPALNVSFPTVAADVGGAAVDGTAATNQVYLAVTNQAITNWPAGAALWLVWEMADSTGKAQGLAIDNLSFSATAMLATTNPPVLSFQSTTASANPFVISWPASATGYQLYSTTNLVPPVAWTLVTNAATTSNGTMSLTILPTNAGQFFRLAAP